MTLSRLSSDGPPIWSTKTAKEWFEAVHPGDRARIEALHSSIADGSDNWNVEYHIVRPDGEVRWLHERAFPAAAAGRAAFRIDGIAEDMTTLKKRSKKINTTRLGFKS